MSNASDPRFHLRFAPESWTSPGKFLAFLGPPFERSRSLNDAVRSCTEHLHKYETFATLATDIQPTLILDREELELNGFSSGRRSQQFAAIIEVLVCELYSLLDGIRYTLYRAYPRCRGVQQSSTSKLFSRAVERAYGPGFPKAIRALLVDAHDDWFFELRRLRTAFTHGGLGSCSLDRDSEKVAYMNSSLGTDTRAHVIEDIVAHVNRLSSGVFALLHGVFDALFSALQPIPSDQMCGLYKCRIYMRRVAPTPNLSSASGECISRTWFEAEPEFFCPLAERCDAYRRAATFQIELPGRAMQNSDESISSDELVGFKKL